MPAQVQIVVCIDTEGPCADPERPELLASWDAVDAAMGKLLDSGFRSRYPDPAGGTLRIGWFFLTWTGFTENPRKRAFGYHAVRDHYLRCFGDRIAACGDEQCWHYHHPPASGVANEWGLDWAHGDEYARILSRQVLERAWFPAGFRSGGTILGPASSRWVDAWFPLDYSNRAPLTLPGLVDWSGGIADWTLYHPDPEDVRRSGAGHRWMARCLDLETNVHVLSVEDVAAGFERARTGRPAIVACFDHDYRDIAGRIDRLRELVRDVSARYPGVPWRYAGPIEALRAYLGVPAPPRLELEVADHAGAVHVRTSAPVHQALPWLALRLPSGEVSHVEEGLLRLDETRWRWDQPPGLEWEELGVAASTGLGEAAVAVVRPGDGPGRSFLARRTERSPARPRSVWEHSKYFHELCIARASGEAEEMDSARQAADLLGPRLPWGARVLDAGCAAGQLWRSLRSLGVEYHGIDPRARAVEIGRLYLEAEGLPPGRLRALALEDLPPDEEYDAVVSLNWLSYEPMFHRPLEALARAARRWLLVRAAFGDETEVRYLPDALLEEGFEGMHTYLNVIGRAELESFLEAEGLAVSWEEDRRRRERFGGEPEVVGGIPIPYEFLVAQRVRPAPSMDEVLGERFGEVARAWRESRRS